MDVRNVPIVVPLFFSGARLCVIDMAVGAKAARISAWKILVG